MPPTMTDTAKPVMNGTKAVSGRRQIANAEVLDVLAEYILDSEEEKAIKFILELDSSAIVDLKRYRVGDRDGIMDSGDGDVSLLQLAAAYSLSVDLISLLASKCPELLTVKRDFPYEGQTVVHTLVSKENVVAVEAILQQQSPAQQQRLLQMSTVTERPCPVNATVLLGGLPLSIAALTFNVEMVDMLLRHGADLAASNDRGDTVFHSLVRFAAIYPEKEVKAKEAMTQLHDRLKHKYEPRSVWLRENNNGMTALKLAALCTQPLLFDYVLALKGVYCDLDEHDGLFDSLLYDITDVDPVAMQQAQGTRRPGSVRPNQVATVEGVPSHKGIVREKSQRLLREEASALTGTSVLEIVYETKKVEDAFKIMSNHVIRQVIKCKWRKYRWLFILWLVFHLFFMIWITVYAVYKSLMTYQLPSPPAPDVAMTTELPPEPVNEATSRPLGTRAESFVLVTAILTALWAVGLLVYELVRLVRVGALKPYFTTLLYHHNGFYRLQLIVFALALLIDACVFLNWHWGHGAANNYCLIIALLVGWWFTSFFLRPWKKFSFFTVMLQEVLLGDMLRFSTIFIPELIAFSVAMHITYLPTPGPMPDAFSTVGTTMMTMFKLMLGLSDIEVLYEAPEQWLAILLFLCYVLLTYSLMLNALIALMSNTCSIVSQNREEQWRLQRLSIVLFLQESLWTCLCLHTTGQPRTVRLDDLHTGQTVTRTRYVLKISSVRGGAGGARLASAVDDLLEGEAGEMDAPSPLTETSRDMCDLLAALNFQRRQQNPEPQPHVPTFEEKLQPGGEIGAEGKAGDGVDGTGPAAAVTVHMKKQTWNSTYTNIRNSLNRLSKGGLTGAQSAVAEEDSFEGPATGFSGRYRKSLPALVPQVSALGPPPVAQTPLSTPPASSANTRRPPSADRRDRTRRRPGSGRDLRDKFRAKHGRNAARGTLSPRESKVEGSAPDLRRPSATNLVGHGIFHVDYSRIHMHTDLQD